MMQTFTNFFKFYLFVTVLSGLAVFAISLILKARDHLKEDPHSKEDQEEPVENRYWDYFLNHFWYDIVDSSPAIALWFLLIPAVLLTLFKFIVFLLEPIKGERWLCLKRAERVVGSLAFTLLMVLVFWIIGFKVCLSVLVSAVTLLVCLFILFVP